MTATAFTISWTLQQYSLNINEFRISVTRRTGSDNDAMLCSQTQVLQETVTSASRLVTFENLQEFSIYSVTFTTHYGTLMDIVNDDVNLTTLSTG